MPRLGGKAKRVGSTLYSTGERTRHEAIFELPTDIECIMSDEDAYARALARISVAQIIYAQAESLCEKSSATNKDAKGKPTRGRLQTANNVSAQSAVVTSLADILGAFIQNIGSKARARAEHAGRIRCALPDVIASLEKRRVETRNLAKYARIETVEFPRTVPAFPVVPKKQAGTKRPHEETTDPLPLGIEGWMPPLPPAHTYISTPGEGPSVLPTDGKARPGRADLAAQRRSVGKSLARLQVAPPATAIVNPFLKPPAIGDEISRDYERAEVREPAEPMDTTNRDSNRPLPPRPSTGESDAKKARIARVLKDSGGVTGHSSAQVAAAAATKENGKMNSSGGGGAANGTPSSGGGAKST